VSFLYASLPYHTVFVYQHLDDDLALDALAFRFLRVRRPRNLVTGVALKASPQWLEDRKIAESGLGRDPLLWLFLARPDRAKRAG